MQQAAHIFNKEIRAYFASPIGYIVISTFLLAVGWFFFLAFFINNQASLRHFFSLLPLMFSFVIPAVTMRLVAEELNVGSYEILLTMPVTFLDVVLGKFFAAVVFVAAMLVPTLAYPITVSFLGDLDWGSVVAGYIGAIMLAAAFSAIGLFASSLTRNQIIAFIIGTAICFSLTMIDWVLFFLPPSFLAVVQYLGAYFRFQNVAKGIIDSRDILYFLSVTFLGLYGAYLVMRRRN
jgi:ABC-2 type transport system permease protein